MDKKLQVSVCAEVAVAVGIGGGPILTAFRFQCLKQLNCVKSCIAI